MVRRWSLFRRRRFGAGSENRPRMNWAILPSRLPRYRKRWPSARIDAAAKLAGRWVFATKLCARMSWRDLALRKIPPIAATTANRNCSIWRGVGAAAGWGFARVLLGTNLDDLGDHRPGLVAARERGAKQPLVRRGLAKRTCGRWRYLGLDVWNKPQLACLSSRFPYGTQRSPRSGSRWSIASSSRSTTWGFAAACVSTSCQRCRAIRFDPACDGAWNLGHVARRRDPPTKRDCRSRQAGRFCTSPSIWKAFAGIGNLVPRRLPRRRKPRHSLSPRLVATEKKTAVRPRKIVVAALVIREPSGTCC